MGIIGGALGYHLLKRINSGGRREACSGDVYANRSKLETLFGEEIWDELADKVVFDFGCGTGEETVEIARRGRASRVIGIDIRESVLMKAREHAARAGVADRCSFVTSTEERGDVIISMDAFEHFDDPAEILRIMRRLMRDDGKAIIEFGPVWYHPLGGHLFSVFPWAHLVFTEKALIRWRSDFKTDGARRFSEIEGGLNQMTISRFERLIKASDFQFESFEAVPIRRLKSFSNRLTREFTTAIVRCRLVARQRQESNS